jgi:hypothetical protein
MNQTASIQEKMTKKEAREQLKLQLAQYLEQQPESLRSFDRWMKVLEWASMGVAVILFIVALVVSFLWKSVTVNVIPAAWFAFPACICLTMILTGVHTLVLKVFPPVAGPQTSAVGLSIPGVTNVKSQQLVTGREALGRGWAFTIGGLVGAAFWGLFAYAAYTLNWEILRPMITVLGVAMGVAIAASILLGIVKGVFQSTSRLR